VSKDGGAPCFRQDFKGGVQRCRLHGEKGDSRTAAAASLTAGNLAGKHILNHPAEGIHF
jgi:hypothetical protein